MEGEQNTTSLMKHSVKDSVFRMLFSMPKYSLEIYQVFHPEDKDITIDDIKDVTIRNYIVNDNYNDIALMVRDELLLLIEAQDTWTENIIIRMHAYRVELLKREIGGNKRYLFRREKAKIATPEYYVIYTGENKNVKDCYSLREEFYGGKGDEEVLIQVKKRGLNDKDILSQYIDFSKRVSAIIKMKGAKNIKREHLVALLEGCIKDGILSEFLSERMLEVMDTMMSMFSEDYLRACIKAEGIDEGIAIGQKEGIAIGQKEGISIGQREGIAKEKLRTAKGMRDAGVDLDLIAQITGLTKKDILKLK